MREILKEAIKSIDQKYFHRNEKDFQFELYHQLKKLNLPPRTEVTCETVKKRFSYNDNVLDDPIIKKHFFRDEINPNIKIHRYPDLLIHEYDTRDNQFLAIEIKKTYSPQSIKKDLAKLAVYCAGKLKFKKGIMIILSPRRNSIVEIPEVPEILINFPMIEIWILNRSDIEVINSTSLNQ